MTRSEAIQQASAQLIVAGIPREEARTDALLLLRHTTSITREEFRMRPDTSLTPEESLRFTAAIERRAKREPLAYITGERGFYGLTFTVNPAVLVPRPETEGIVETVLSLTGSALEAEPISILDIGVGSGAIAVAIAVHAPNAQVYGIDLSAAALAVARKNAARHQVAERVTLLTGDLFAPLPADMRFTAIVSNPPYIAPEEIETLEPEIRNYEPRIALGMHADALHFYRRLTSEAPSRLLSSGALIVEVGQGQAESVAELFTDAGFEAVTILPDLAGIGRIVHGKWNEHTTTFG